MSRKEEEKKETPFEGKKVFFSASIRGAEEHAPGIFLKLVKFMQGDGAEVLTEHVAVRERAERDAIFLEKTGVDITQLERPSETVRKIDIGWVDEADYLVAEVTSPSLGVGMELQRGIDKDKLGLNHTKILCLCRQELLDKDSLSWMIGGITPEEHSDFHLLGYSTLEEAKEIIYRFLTDTLGKD